MRFEVKEDGNDCRMIKVSTVNGRQWQSLQKETAIFTINWLRELLLPLLEKG